MLRAHERDPGTLPVDGDAGVGITVSAALRARPVIVAGGHPDGRAIKPADLFVVHISILADYADDRIPTPGRARPGEIG